MSEQTPSAHSMTVETSEHVEDIAAELFKLRQWKAEALKTVDRIMSERDEARHELASLSTTWTAVRVQQLQKQQAEDTAARNAIAVELDEARAEISRLGVMADALAAERDEAKRNLDGLLVAGFNTPPGKCTNCAEMRGTLDELRAALQVQTDAHRKAATELIKIRDNDDVHRAELARLYKERSERETQLLDAQKAVAKLDKEGAELAKERDDYQRSFWLVRDMFRGALEALG